MSHQPSMAHEGGGRGPSDGLRLAVRRPVRLLVDRETSRTELLDAVDQAWRGGHDLVEIVEGATEALPRRTLVAAARRVATRGLRLQLTGPVARFATLEGYAARLVDRGNLVAARAVVPDGKVAAVDRAGHAALRSLGVAVAWLCEVSGRASSAELGVWARQEPLGAALSPEEGASIEWAPRSDADPAIVGPLIAASRVPGQGVSGLPLCVPGGDPAEASVAATLRHTVDLRGGLGCVTVKPPACAGCPAHGDCPGVSVEAFRAHGGRGLQPLTVAPARSARSLRGVPIFDRRRAAGHRVAEAERLDVAPRYPDTALITLIVPGCDLACIFCETPQGDQGLMPSTPRGVRAALAAMAGSTDGVFFTGGEPTRLPWLLDAFREARTLGFSRIQMQSHAGRAADPAVARQWVDAGLTGVDVPLYGPDAAAHEAITNTPGSFDRTMAGLRNLTALGVRSVVHVTLFRSNLGRLVEVLEVIDALGPDAAYLQTTGEVGPPGTYAAVAPSPSAVAEAVSAALTATTPKTPLTIADVVPCLLPSQEQAIARWRGAPLRGAAPVVLPYSDWLAVFSAGATRAWGPTCDTCAAREACPGLPREALDRFGAGALRPIP